MLIILIVIVLVPLLLYFVTGTRELNIHRILLMIAPIVISVIIWLVLGQHEAHRVIYGGYYNEYNKIGINSILEVATAVFWYVPIIGLLVGVILVNLRNS